MRAASLGSAIGFLLLGSGCLGTPDDGAVGSSGEAITYGELDGNDHPEVVLIITEVDGHPAWRCSGALISPTVVLTAGHCTSNFPNAGQVTGGRIFLDSDVEAGMGGVTNNYPYGGLNSVEAVAMFAHPLYETGPFFLHDVGVVVLEEPGVALDHYASLPEVNELDALRPRRTTTFTPVGYGLQRIHPLWTEAVRVRMRAHPWLVQINGGTAGGSSLLLSNNASTGGTCFGDSGGPNFLGDTGVVAGVTSFALNGQCGGTGGVFRMDRADVLDFVRPFLAP